MNSWLKRFDSLSTAAKAAVIIALSLCIGLFDYVTGTHVSVSVFYLLPISIAAWTMETTFAIFVSGLCVAAWAIGDIIAGGDDLHPPYILVWNAVVQFISFVIVVEALTHLRSLQRELEERVQQRAAALTAEVAKREKLQRELLEVSEREQRRFGQDLHDGLCQHLAATALAGHVLGEKLAARSQGEAKDARKVVALIEEGINLSHQLAKGLHPVDLDSAGLMQALQEFAANTSDLHKVACKFECEMPVPIHDPGVAGHMFRIAQEAVRNATRHGGARNIVIRLETLDEGLKLSIEDDGSGMPDQSKAAKPRVHSGMGLRIMAHRSHMIGAIFQVQSRPDGTGTIVSCLLPANAGSMEVMREQAVV